jgi:hypothetical protein
MDLTAAAALAAKAREASATLLPVLEDLVLVRKVGGRR